MTACYLDSTFCYQIIKTGILRCGFIQEVTRISVAFRYRTSIGLHCIQEWRLSYNGRATSQKRSQVSSKLTVTIQWRRTFLQIGLYSGNDLRSGSGISENSEAEGSLAWGELCGIWSIKVRRLGGFEAYRVSIWLVASFS